MFDRAKYCLVRREAPETVYAQKKGHVFLVFSAV
jgi:hypothetical protein